MAVLKTGSSGSDVAQLQTQLKELGLLDGAADGAFGPATNAAVEAFQTQHGVSADGVVGPTTWGLLFPNGAPSAAAQPAAVTGGAMADQVLAYRCLALTGTIETSAMPPDCFAGLSGDFDKQGISFGALQWNFGQNTLQPLLVEMDTNHTAILSGVFGDNYAALHATLAADQTTQMAWIRGIQANNKLNAPWAAQFKALGHTAEFQAIEVESANRYYAKGVTMAKQFGLTSQRAVALMFDIAVQNGSINAAVTQQINADIAALTSTGDAREVAIMTSVANRRAEAANPTYVEDVRKRKLMIANGGGGPVHGVTYNLARDFAITLDAAPELATSTV